MRIICWLSVFSLVILCSAVNIGANPRPDKTVIFNQGWRFHLGDVPDAKDQGFDDSQWRTLNLPHDWSIEGEFDEKNPAGTGGGALPGGTGWYRKTFNVPATQRESWFSSTSTASIATARSGSMGTISASDLTATVF
jgi:hypothetical protein